MKFRTNKFRPGLKCYLKNGAADLILLNKERNKKGRILWYAKVIWNSGALKGQVMYERISFFEEDISLIIK